MYEFSNGLFYKKAERIVKHITIFDYETQLKLFTSILEQKSSSCWILCSSNFLTSQKCAGSNVGIENADSVCYLYMLHKV